MKNKLVDLNNHLFCQLERLSEEETKGKELLEEIGRAKAVTEVAREIISNGKLVIEAKKVMKEYFIDDGEAMPKMLSGDEAKEKKNQ